MSTIVMGLCWPLQMPPTPKAVLMSLADQANDHGSCWPSLAGLVARTCFSRTSVIEALKALEDFGLLAIERSGGRTNRYQIDMTRLRQQEMPSYAQPVRQPDRYGSRTGTGAVQTSPAAAPPPVRQPDPNRQSIQKEKTTRASALTVDKLVEDGLTEQTANEYLAHRRKRRATLTARAWDDIKAEISKVGWSNEKGVRKALGRGWTGFEADWVKSDERSAPITVASSTAAATQQYLTEQALTPEQRAAADKARELAMGAVRRAA